MKSPISFLDSRVNHFHNLYSLLLPALTLFQLLSAATFVSAAPPATLQNPIIPGFYPDPSICRAGDDYYLVNSSFEFFPGVPVFHSKDLVHWQQIGYCLTRKSQLRLDHARASRGIFAPTIRYHNGTFYMITTLIDTGGNFFVTATNPAGPWSEPVWIDKPGIDPSLFFDDDGTVFYDRHEGGGDGFIGQSKIDVQTGKLESPLKEVWRGTGSVWPEGPHLYKINGKYFIMTAEGGTSYGHMVTIARSDSVWGPFSPNPQNPILTHRRRPTHPAQALGHADLVETPDGWWMVCLGIRPQGGKFHHLGRETYLAPVAWSKDNWPVVNGNGTLELTMPAPRLPQHPWPQEPERDNFDQPQLRVEWNFLRNPYDADWSLSERSGFLRLHGSAVTLNDNDSPALICRRQTALGCKVSTLLDFNPQRTNEEAGLVVRGNEKNHYDLGVTRHDGRRQVFLRKTLAGQTAPIDYSEIGEGPVVLSVEAQPLAYKFSVQPVRGEAKELGTAPTKELSSEKVGGFTGVVLGLYATGNGLKSSTPADFDWFDYKVVER
jgi:alpha-N-arabinofuranosidase